MTDRELLELAAKATGDFYQHPSHEIPENFPVAFYLNEKRWNPLTDDGDALRLAVKLHMLEEGIAPFVELMWRLGTETGTDDYAATRRAIVRAAAEIGKAK